MHGGRAVAIFLQERQNFVKKKKNHLSCLQQDVPCLEFWLGFFNMEHLYKTDIGLWLIYVRPVLSSLLVPHSRTHTRTHTCRSRRGSELAYTARTQHPTELSGRGGELLEPGLKASWWDDTRT